MKSGRYQRSHKKKKDQFKQMNMFNIELYAQHKTKQEMPRADFLKID